MYYKDEKEDKGMKEMIRKILGWKPGKWLLASIAVLGAIGLLIPLFRIVIYTAPWYDDFNYGFYTRNFLELEYNFASALKGVMYCVKTSWYAWQGTFSSIFFMALVPVAWGEQYYFLGPLFVLVLLLLGILALTKVLLRGVLKVEWAYCLMIQAVVITLVFEFIYSVDGGFYWYNSAVHYVGMHAFMLLLIAAWIQLFVGRKKFANVFWILCTLVGSVLAGGANYITALQGLLVGLSLTALGILIKSRRTFCMIPSLLVYAGAFYMNTAAPGNSVRTNVLGGRKLSPLMAVLRSFQEAFAHIPLPLFTGWTTILLLILLIPIIWQMTKHLKFQFRLPGLVLAWSFCLYATGYTPSLYALGTPGLARTLNAVKITYQLLLVMNEIYFLGWLQRKLKNRKGLLDQGAAWWFYALVGIAIIGIFIAEPNKTRFYSSYAAYNYVHTGEACNFREEYLSRVETIRNGGDDVVVKPIDYKPWILYPSDLSDNPQNEANQAMAKWYRKNSITCIPVDVE